VFLALKGTHSVIEFVCGTVKTQHQGAGITSARHITDGDNWDGKSKGNRCQEGTRTLCRIGCTSQEHKYAPDIFISLEFRDVKYSQSSTKEHVICDTFHLAQNNIEIHSHGSQVVQPRTTFVNGGRALAISVTGD